MAFVAAAFGSTFSKKLAAFCGYLNVFSKLSQFLFGILLDFRHLTCGFVRCFEIVVGTGLESCFEAKQFIFHVDFGVNNLEENLLTFEVLTVQKSVNTVDLVKSFPATIYLRQIGFNTGENEPLKVSMGFNSFFDSPH